MPEATTFDRITLTFSLGVNRKSGRPQWQARRGGVLFVPHYETTTPTHDGEEWECRRVDQIGDNGIRGYGVVVVWLIRRYVSPTQQRKQGREAHRQQLANA